MKESYELEIGMKVLDPSAFIRKYYAIFNECV